MVGVHLMFAIAAAITAACAHAVAPMEVHPPLGAVDMHFCRAARLPVALCQHFSCLCTCQGGWREELALQQIGHSGQVLVSGIKPPSCTSSPRHLPFR